jgi:hypothetical protein
MNLVGEVVFVPVNLAEIDWSTSGVMTRDDGEQWLILHDGRYGVAIRGIQDAMDVTDLALKIEATGRGARPAGR